MNKEEQTKIDNQHAELSETKSGYIYVTGASDRESRPDIRAKKARKADAALAQLSALQQLLTDPDYAVAYTKARTTINDFKERISERLEQLDQRIDTLDDKLENVTRGSPEHKRITREREGLQRNQQDVLDYYNDTIRPIEERMDDPDNPPSKEELDDFNDRVEKDLENRFFNPPQEKASFEIMPLDLEVPTLG